MTAREIARAQITALVGRTTDGDEFGAIIAAAVRRVLPFDGWCLLGVSAEGLRTFQFSRNGTDAAHCRQMARNEALMADVNNYAELARRRVPVASLSKEHPAAATSFRFNEVLRPQGFHSELRLALADRGHTWGAMALFRDSPHRLFNDADVALVSTITPALTAAVRHYPVRPARTHPPPLPAGVALVSPDDRIVAVSDTARAWLDDLQPGGSDETGSDDVTRVIYEAAIVARQQRVARQTACIRTASGRWLALEATLIDTDTADVAVLFQPATPDQLLRVATAHHGLTRREAQILTALAQGLPSKQVATKFGIAVHTVNSQLRSIYRKFQVTGREELFGQLR